MTSPWAGRRDLPTSNGPDLVAFSTDVRANCIAKKTLSLECSSGLVCSAIWMSAPLNLSSCGDIMRRGKDKVHLTRFVFCTCICQEFPIPLLKRPSLPEVFSLWLEIPGAIGHEDFLDANGHLGCSLNISFSIYTAANMVYGARLIAQALHDLDVKVIHAINSHYLCLICNRSSSAYPAFQ